MWSSPQACEKLLAHRIDSKMKAHKVQDVVHRLHVAIPLARDNKARRHCVAPGLADGHRRGRR